MMNQKPVLETNQLHIGYSSRGTTNTIVSSIDVSLFAGELVCLLGPNGAGKSTLIRTLAGMQKPLGGQVLLNGDNVHHMSARTLARSLSVVLTDHPDVGLLSGYGLVALGRHPYTNWIGHLTSRDEQVIQWAIHAVGAQEIAHHPVIEMSDGQRQKIMIARALAQEPDIIILDEPTAFLDLPRRVEVMQLLKKLARETGCAVLLSTHDLDLALRTADKLWLMADGKLDTGIPEDLILSGRFESAFRREGVMFDANSGSFKMQAQHAGVVALSGQGIAYIWTQRALEREGFILADDMSNHLDACVDIFAENDHFVWRLSGSDDMGTFRNISDLMESLRTMMNNKTMQVSY